MRVVCGAESPPAVLARSSTSTPPGRAPDDGGQHALLLLGHDKVRDCAGGQAEAVSGMTWATAAAPAPAPPGVEARA